MKKRARISTGITATVNPTEGFIRINVPIEGFAGKELEDIYLQGAKAAIKAVRLAIVDAKGKKILSGIAKSSVSGRISPINSRVVHGGVSGRISPIKSRVVHGGVGGGNSPIKSRVVRGGVGGGNIRDIEKLAVGTVVHNRAMPLKSKGTKTTKGRY